MLIQPYHFFPDPSNAPKQIQDLNEIIKYINILAKIGILK